MATDGPAVTRTGNPLRSTWRTDKSQWGLPHWMFEIFDVHPSINGKPLPKFHKQDPVVRMTVWSAHWWIIVHAAWPLALHQLYFSTQGGNPAAGWVWLFYILCFKLNAISEFHMMRALTYVYGCLDGDKHARDEIPDKRVMSTFISLIFTASIRPVIMIFFAYDPAKSPISMSPWVIAEVGMYALTLDFYYYWYHRVLHESETLWPIHRTHHLTKHPSPLLTLYADQIQELFDALIIPFMTFYTLRLMGFPMGYYDLWMCNQYIVFTELFGHSGMRILANPPSSIQWFLQIFDAQLCIEDHDLHHRQGWKKSCNYGKQTRFWDMIFGTCGKRIELVPDNFTDSTYTADIPLFPWLLKDNSRRTHPVPTDELKHGSRQAVNPLA